MSWDGVIWHAPIHSDAPDKEPTVKCPLKFRLQAFEGSEECDKDCAWNVRSECAIAILASK